MSSNLEPEEVQAIMDLAAPEEGPRRSPPEVSPRNFSKPLRLSPERLSNAHKRAHSALSTIADLFTSSLRKTHELEVVDVSEINAANIFGATTEPFVIARFDAGGQPGWLVWELGAALSTAEILLGACEPEAQDPRPFSTLERRALERLLSPLVATLSTALGVETAGLELLRTVEDIGSWTDGGEQSEPSRLHLALSFDGPGGASTLDLYLPGIQPEGSRSKPEQPVSALPHHLDAVTVNVVARLGANHIPLADLLAIEVGDVIPLETPVTEPLRIYVEDVPQPCGRGYLGIKRGNLAIRVEQIGLEDEDSLGATQ